ncbi:MAG: 3-oxoacyl-[acyl-carrier-protein] reductase [Candidatus Latescibacteria bacterium]|jgi:3-oxoacyl-[acyl-carrier protein] reductase|nr:3-oxoacyl-[acyl-carrier-protein] reductase [Candidatus Latescibacterota bacterium]
MDLTSKTAIVTGGAQGIGWDCVEKLSGAGTNIVIADIQDESVGSEAAKKVVQAGGQAIYVQCNVTDEDDVGSMVEKAVEEFGGLSILINNAGITSDTLMLRMKFEQWSRVIETNLTSMFLTTQAAVRPMMKARWGRIVNISSIIGRIGNPGQANYAASKAGVIGLTKTTAKEFAPRGITANAVAPGFIASRMTDTLDEKYKQQLLEAIPLGRIGGTEDVANLVSFLASEEASYITGQVINVDGGMAM